MHIAFITHSLGFGGAEKNIKFLSERLVTLGNDVDIIYIKGLIPLYMAKHRIDLDNRIKVYDINASEMRGIRRLVQFINVTRLIGRLQPDIIIGFTVYPNFMSSLAGKLLHIPSIICERGDPHTEFANPSILQKIVLRVINNADGGVFQTDGAMDFYSPKLASKSVVIPNSIFTPSSYKPQIVEFREKSVISVGRLDNIQKRYDVMLKAFRLFVDRYPDYILKIYGDGEYRPQILSLISELHLEKNVKMYGVIKDAMLKISREGIFLITSDYEGIPNALLEAMAVGVPVVSTDCTPGGARVLIQDHQNGLLVPKGDINAIANALIEYAENPELAKKCGENASEVLVKYSPENVVNEWISYLSTFR